jgi:hypothetical protein
MRSAQTAIPGNRKDNRAFSRNRASIGAVRTYLVSGDCGPQRPRFVASAMSSPEIGAVWGVFIGPLNPRKQTSVRFYAKVRFGSIAVIRVAALDAVSSSLLAQV